jgi:hypothetical protein
VKLIIVLFLSVLLAGCAHQTVPGPYAALTISDAIAQLRQQTDSVHTISAQGTIALNKPSGDSIRLDSAMVARIPGQLHLRAWKLNRTVFDLTLTPDGLWMLTPQDARLRQRMQNGKFGTIQFARAWDMLSHDFFFSTNLNAKLEGDTLILSRKDQAGKVICYVERSTLNPKEFALYDPSGKKQFDMRLSDYAEHDGVIYPSRLNAGSRFGELDVHLRDIRINQPLSSQAFVPSPRAEKMP